MNARLSISPKENYINNVFAKEDIHLTRIRKALRDDGKEGINISPYEGRILQLLLNLISAKNIVEIGTLYGYSSLWMAYALTSGDCILSLEKNEDHAKKARVLLDQTPVKDKVKILVGEAKENLEKNVMQELSGPLDMVFIDADKIAYGDYLDWAEVHVRKGGLIVADNTFLFGNVISKVKGSEYDEKATQMMKDFNQRLANAKKYRSVIIPTSEGLTVAQKIF